MNGKQAHPCLLLGYGAYGINTDPYFDKSIFSLVDRGYLYCIGQIRGSSFNGIQWYHDGKLLQKMNTCIDFESCAKFLLQNNYTNHYQLVIQGRSAGGITIGHCLNMNPSLYNVAILDVPFVDCITTMLDDSIPLTIDDSLKVEVEL